MLVATFFGPAMCISEVDRQLVPLATVFNMLHFFLRRRDCCNFMWSYWQQAGCSLIVSIHHSFALITKVSWVSAYNNSVGRCFQCLTVLKTLCSNNMSVPIFFFYQPLPRSGHTLCIAHSPSLRVFPFKPTLNILSPWSTVKKKKWLLLCVFSYLCRWLC